jgi:hypothetical protein
MKNFTHPMEGDQIFQSSRGIEFFFIAIGFGDRIFLSPQGLAIKNNWS